jgi:PAS domain-containing protein
MGVRNAELAAFLQSRRRRLTPTEIGLPQSCHRRVSCLRREEVAWAADVGITWYTWLEQGRPIKIAGETLDRIAAALRLDASETEYLHKLARALLYHHERWSTAISNRVRGLVEGYSSGYAFVIDHLWDILAWNERAARLFGLNTRKTGLERNGVWLIFTRSSLRAALFDWKEVARQTVAMLRVEYADYVGNAEFNGLITALSKESSEFTQLWAMADVLLPTCWTLGKVRDRPNETRRFETVALPIPESPGQTLIFHYAVRARTN